MEDEPIPILNPQVRTEIPEVDTSDEIQEHVRLESTKQAILERLLPREQHVLAVAHGLRIRESAIRRHFDQLEAAGFVHGNTLDLDMFLDGPNGRVKDAVHVVFAKEKVRADHATPSPDVADSEPGAQFQVVSLDALVQMKLNSFRLKDRVHLLDMIGVGLVDQTWPTRLPPELAPRLQQLLDNPDG